MLLVMTIIGCQNLDKKEKNLVQKEKPFVQKEFGKWKTKNDSLGVELDFNRFKNWTDLVKRTEEIICNDSLPKITLKTDKELKTIYFRNFCWNDDSFKFVKQKNVFEIYNDTINRNGERTFPLDSLESVLRRDIKNNGENPRLSENPEKLMIFVYYDNKYGFKKLPETLDQLTETYNRITNKTDIKISLIDKENFSPPLPPKN